MADNKSIWETRSGAWKREGKRDWDDPRLYLRQAGTVSGMLGDYIAYPIEATASAIDDALLQGAGKKGIEKGVNYLLNETEAGKAVVRLARENPEIAKDLMDGANILGAIPVLRIASKAGVQGVKAALNKAGGVKQRAKAGVGGVIGSSSAPGAVARNMPTLVQGGTAGDMADAFRLVKGTGLRTAPQILRGTGRTPKTGLPYYGGAGGMATKGLSTLGEAVRAAPVALRELTSPQALANYEAKGLSRNAVNREIPALRESEDFLGERGAITMQSQIKKGATVGDKEPPLLSSNSPLMLNQRLAEFDFNDAGLIPDIKKTVFKNVPDPIAERHLAHIRAVHGIDSSNPAVLSVKPPKTDGIARELLGTDKTGDPAIRKLTVGNLIPEYKKLVGMDQREKLSPTQMIEVLQVSVGLTKDVQRGMLNYMGTAGGAVTPSGKKMEKLLDANSRGKLIDEVIKARAKQQGQQKLTKRESRVLEAWNAVGKVATIKNKDGKVVSNKDTGLIPVLAPDDTLSFSSSYLSKIKELGGVNYVGTVDLKSNKAYLTLSDGSDLFGIGGGPKGAPDVIVTTPTQVVELGSRRTAGGKVKKRELKKGEKFDGPATPVKVTSKVPQRFELDRTVQKRKVTKKEMDAEVKKLEDFTGEKIKKNESPEDFHRRLLLTYNAPVKPRHKKEALKNQITLGTMAVQADTRNNPGLFSAYGG